MTKKKTGRPKMSYAKVHTHLLQRVKRIMCKHCGNYVPYYRQLRKEVYCGKTCEKIAERYHKHIEDNKDNESYTRRPSIYDYPIAVTF